jgi:ribonucleoside-diphosphate reductase alpha chain
MTPRLQPDVGVANRAQRVPERVKALVMESRRWFPNTLSELIYARTYSRWLEAEQRRETWVETVDRYVGFMRERLGAALGEDDYAAVRRGIVSMQVMPSMRLLWSAGDGARASHATAYNCAYLAPTCAADLAELMYVLMCGAGVGFSVERRFVDQFPVVKPQRGERLPRHIIGDSRAGWCDALKLGLGAWFEGRDVDFDYSQLRPAGARVLTLGGRASGPGPLRALFEFARALLVSAPGRRLTSLEMHDLICKIGEVVVMGGVRRSALISLSDLDDHALRDAKQGHFYLQHPERALANDSAVYESRPKATVFLAEWLALANSGTGERGLFNRGGLDRQLPMRRRRGFETYRSSSGTNPCGEIVLRSKQFCNLSEAVARAGDTETALLEKVRLAALIGTYQASLTDFPYLSSDWTRNCEEERLLGVSITGQWDCAAARDGETLQRLREAAVEANRTWAARLGIAPAMAVTCVKPSGTVSLLVDSASGMHPRHAPHYLRRVRISAVDPLLALLKDQGFPLLPEAGQLDGQASTYVLELPLRSPEGAVVRDALTARAQLEHWLMVKQRYTEHNPSVTISVGADEWISTADWLYEHWEFLGGLAFLPRGGTSYSLAPLQEISAADYHARVATLPQLDLSQLVLYEQEDHTAGARALACVGDACELDPEEGSLPAQPPQEGA